MITSINCICMKVFYFGRHDELRYLKPVGCFKVEGVNASKYL